MKRFAYDYLVEWSRKEGRKPLVLRGARQVGKSYLVRDFGSSHFEQVVEINFEKKPELAELFHNRPPEKILQLLEIQFQVKIKPEKTLLFLDEIQAAPEVIPGLRYFYEDFPKLHLIAAGSLLEFALRDHTFSMPVGRIEYGHLGPMTFEEFLLAVGETRLQDYLAHWTFEQEIPEVLHNSLLEKARTFGLIGGMPEVVQAYVQDQSFDRCEALKHNLLSTYQDDIHKYEQADYHRLRKVFQKVPHLIGDKIKYVHIDPHERSKDLAKTLDLLCMTQSVYRVVHSAANGVPLGAQTNEKFFKLLFLDVGLVSTACGLNLLDFEKAEDIQLVNQGKISEQWIGQHLLYRGPFYKTPELYCWMREQKSSSAEVDFVISHGSQVVPVEVKSGKTGWLKSLHLFVKEKKVPLAVRFNSERPTRIHSEGLILSLPFYLVGQLDRLLAGE